MTNSKSERLNPPATERLNPPTPHANKNTNMLTRSSTPGQRIPKKSTTPTRTKFIFHLAFLPPFIILYIFYLTPMAYIKPAYFKILVYLGFLL